jgi:flagellar motor protein MotB
MKANSARKRTKKGKKTAAQKRRDEEKKKEAKAEDGRNFARRNFDEVYDKIMKDIQERCDEGGSKFTWSEVSFRSDGPFNYACKEETKELVENKLKEDGYTVKRSNKNEHIRYSDDDPGSNGNVTTLEISW